MRLFGSILVAANWSLRSSSDKVTEGGDTACAGATISNANVDVDVCRTTRLCAGLVLEEKSVA